MIDNFTMNVHSRYVEIGKEIKRLEKKLKEFTWKNDLLYIRRLLTKIKLSKEKEKMELINNNLKAHL